MQYILVLILLFIAELVYFRIANKYNIIDKPNERSSHTSITLRGGGIIFYVGALSYFIMGGFQYPFFMVGLTLLTAVSFADDVLDVSNRIRLSIHLVSVLLMAYQLDVIGMPWYSLAIAFVTVIGVINAYNFMDGINGITASYSLAVAGLLAIVNNQIGFIDQDLLYYTLIATLVFAFFNFRTKAKSFAGDVGSISMAYILIFVLATVIIHTQNLIYMLFLSVYGIDAVWTILRRLSKKENIFQAHRTHLYQYLGNEAGMNKLLVSFLYGVIQFGIGLLVLQFADKEYTTQLIFSLTLLLVMSALYLIGKKMILQKYVTDASE